MISPKWQKRLRRRLYRLKYSVGLKFSRANKGGWYAGLGLHWFCVMFYRNCGPDIFDRETIDWTGISLSWKPNPLARPGDLIWSKCKKWGIYA